jgi:hypothetical protein
MNEKKRGGARPNSGPKKIGTTRKVSITLPDEEWSKIDHEIKGKQTYANYFRNLHLNR